MNILSIEKKKVLWNLVVLLLALFMLLGVIPGMAASVKAADVWDGSTVATGYAGGAGTSEAPYQIAKGEQLAYLASQVNGGISLSGVYFQLTDDIDLGAKEWTPIGNNSNFFSGKFDGNNHTISNLEINSSLNNVGLFGRTSSSSSEIKNLGLLNISINSTGICTGGLVGYQVNGATITNCYATGSVSGTNYVGGLVGFSNSATTVTNCHATGIVNGTDYVGGLLGIAFATTITNCYATGSVTGTDGAGGLVGQSDLQSKITNCYATGSVTGTNNVGGLAGYKNDNSSEYGYWNSSAAQTAGGALQTGKGIGLAYCIDTTVAMTSAEMQTNAFAAILTSNSTAAGYPKKWKHNSTVNNGYPVFDDTVVGDTTAPVLAVTSVSNVALATASGTTTANATLNFTSDEVGTYYYFVCASGTAAVTAATVEAQGTAGANGAGSATAETGVNTVNVTWAQGAAAYNAYIIVEDISGNVSSVKAVPIVFVHFKTDATDTVYTATANSGGGAVTYSIIGGEDQDKFSIDSSTGALSFVNSPDYENPTDSDANNLYNVIITATDSNGAVSQSVTVIIHSGVWDGTVVTDYEGGDGTSGNPYRIATGAQLAYMASQVNGGNTYENKYFQLTEDLNLGGLEWTPIAKDTYWFLGNFDGSNHTISNLTVTSSLDYKGLFGSVGISVIKNIGLLDVSISGPSPDSYSSVGSLAGRSSATISNCYATGSVTGDFQTGGLVGYFNSATISNCYTTCNVIGSGGICHYIGGVVGRIDYGTITDCYAAGSVTGSGVVGGLLGYNVGTIRNCYATSSVTGSGNLGGLVGENYYGTNTNCYATGSVTGIGDYKSGTIGGLVGVNSSSTITNCFATGGLAANGTGPSKCVGGLVGNYGSGSISNGYWNSSVAQTVSGALQTGKGVGKGAGTDTTVPMTSAELKTNVFAAILTSNSTATGYPKRWKYNLSENSGYPVFDNTVGGDTTAPVLTGTSVSNVTAVTANSITTTAATLNFTSDEVGTYYYIVYASEAAAPSLAAVEGQGTAVAKGKGTVSVLANTADLTGLSGAAAYKAYILVEDVSGNPSSMETVTIAFPVFTSGETVSFDENSTLTVYTATTSSDSGTVAYSITGGADQVGFELDSATGALTFVSSPDYEKPADSDTNNVYYVTLTVTDSNGSVSQSVAVTVTNVNEAPVVKNKKLLTINEDAVTVIENSSLQVSDVDTAAALITYTIAADPSMGTLKNGSTTLSASGTKTFTQQDIDDHSITYNPIANQYGLDSFTFMVSDDAEGTLGSTTFDISITAVNDKPVISITGPTTNVIYNGTQTISISGTVTDVEQQTVVVSAEINGKTSTTSVDTSSTNTWTLTWGISGLSIEDGTYTGITFNAVDTDDEIGSATYTGDILVDAEAPNTTIDSSQVPLTNSTSAGFNFSSEAAAIFEVSIDGENYSVSTSSKEYTGLLEGPHTFRVRAIDTAGNKDATPASCTWTIDTTPPAVPTVTGALYSKNPQPTWNWVSSGDGKGIFRYKMDNSDLSTEATEISATSYTPGSVLSDGNHTLYVQEIDEAGNWSDIGNASTSVDATAPTAGLTSPSGTNVAVSASSIIMVFSETVTAVATEKVTISDETNTYTYTIGTSDNYISGTGSGCTATIPVSSFLNGIKPLSLGYDMTYTVAVEAGAYIDSVGNGIVANNNIGSFKIEKAPVSIVTLTGSPTAGGIVSGSGTYNEGSSVTVTAAAYAGYSFVNWTEGSTEVSASANYNFTLGMADRTLTANFIPITHTVSVIGSPTSGGTVSGGGTYNEGTAVTVTAAAYAGYSFVKWTESSTEVSTSASYNFSLGTTDRTLTANFIPITHTVSVIGSPTAGGTVSGSGTYNEGASVTVTAAANSGYSFVNWTESSTEVSASTSYNFSLGTTDRTLTANFIPITHTVSVIGSPTAGGTVSGSGTYNEGASVTVTAAAYAGYSFVKWTEGSTEVSASTSYNFTLGTAERTLIACFSAKPISTYTVTFKSWDGTVLKTETVEKGKGASSPTAQTRTGYIFNGWDKVFNSITNDLTVTAKYIENILPVTDADRVAQDQAALNIGFAAGDSDGAVTKNLTLIDTGTINGSTITWKSDKPDVISNDGKVTRQTFSSTDVTVTASIYYNGASGTKAFDITVLKLEPVLYNVTVSANPSKGGTVSGSGTYNQGSSVTVTAEVYAGYSFDNWTEYGIEVSTSASYTFTLGTAGRTLAANFTVNPVTIYTVVVFKDWNGTVLKTETVEAGKGASAPADPTRTGYTFTGWDKPFSNVTSNLTVMAQYNNNGGGHGGGSSTTTVTPKAEITVTENTITATTTVAATVDYSGETTVTVTHIQISDALDKLVAEAAKQGEGTVAAIIEIKVTAPTAAKTIETNLSKTTVDAVAGSNTVALTISTPIAAITFDGKALDTIAREAVADVKISVAKVDAGTLNKESKQLVGDRPVFNFNVTSGDKTISQFGGSVSVSVPYTPKVGEDTNSIVIYYINSQGNPEIVSNCAYDTAKGSITFNTSHFSQYAVGYNKVSFKDVPVNAWYSNAVGFVAARGITKGIGDGNYSPEAKLTRGQFIVMMMRAYGIDPDENPKNNFADAGNNDFTGYLAVAKRLGITVGVGNNMYAPDLEITRQEMFTLLYNTLKTMNELPTGKAVKTLTDFADADQIDPMAKDAMALFVGTGAITGSGGKLCPTDTTNRAEMAQILYMLLSK